MSFDFYQVLSPFGFAIAIGSCPLGIDGMNGILKPNTSATGGMVTESDKAIATLLEQKAEAVKNSRYWQMYVGEGGSGDSDKWYKYTYPEDPNREDEGLWSGIGNDIKFWMDKQSYNFRNSIKQWMSEVLKLLFAADDRKSTRLKYSH